MTNILEAIYNIAKNNNFSIKTLNSGRNRMNNMGEALEKFVIDAFADTFSVSDEAKKMQIQSEKFSWLGNQNNPPDALIRNGDAIEVKKTQSPNSDLALNSSYPKAKLHHNNPQIAKGCVTCEEWTERDIIYTVGYTSDTQLNSVWMVYGTIYAAEQDIYERIKNKIKDGVNSIPNIEFAETKELGGIKKVDPLGITNLRIRGMWHIHNPRKVFNYLNLSENDYKLVAIIPTTKYNSFPKESIQKLEKTTLKNLKTQNIKVKNPNNPVDLIECKLITIGK